MINKKYKIPCVFKETFCKISSYVKDRLKTSKCPGCYLYFACNSMFTGITLPHDIATDLIYRSTLRNGSARNSTAPVRPDSRVLRIGGALAAPPQKKPSLVTQETRESKGPRPNPFAPKYSLLHVTAQGGC